MVVVGDEVRVVAVVAASAYNGYVSTVCVNSPHARSQNGIRLITTSFSLLYLNDMSYVSYF